MRHPPPVTTWPSDERAAAAGLPLRVRCVEDAAELPALGAAWEALIDDAHPGAVFRAPTWLCAWWKHFSPGKALRTYTIRRGDRLVGVLPAFRVATPLGGHRLRLMGDRQVGSDYLGLIARPEDQAPVARALAEALCAEERELVFDFVERGDPLEQALRERAALASWGREHGLAAEPLLPCPYLDVAAAGELGRWLETLPQGAGAQLRRRRRWLEKQAGLSIEVVREPERMAAALETLWRLHRARWERDGGSDALESPRTLAFHAEVAEALARRGEARIYLLHAEGAPRAALYGFERGGRFSYFQSGSDPAWRQRSVGTVVLGAAIEDAFARGLREFDFLHGDESYKATFASGRRELVRLRLGCGPRAWVQGVFDEQVRAGRRWLRERLPRGAVDRIRQLERHLRWWEGKR